MLAFLAMPIKFIEIGIGIKKLKPKEPFQRSEKNIYVGYNQIRVLLYLQPDCNVN